MVATVDIEGLEPDQIPQLMLFLANSTGLGTSAVPVTTTGAQAPCSPISSSCASDLHTRSFGPYAGRKQSDAAHCRLLAAPQLLPAHSGACLRRPCLQQRPGLHCCRAAQAGPASSGLPWYHEQDSALRLLSEQHACCTGYQVMAEVPAPAAPARPPPVGPVAAPPPQASATPSPVPASPGNPNVDLNVAMRIFGSQIVPFTATNQFVAASALAGAAPPTGACQRVNSTRWQPVLTTSSNRALSSSHSQPCQYRAGPCRPVRCQLGCAPRLTTDAGAAVQACSAL